MARVEGFEPAHSGQAPIDVNGSAVSVGVWGDSNIGVGVLGTSGRPEVDNVPVNVAGVVGHSIQHPGVIGQSIQVQGVRGESKHAVGVLGRSMNSNGVLGVTFVAVDPNGNPGASGVFGSSTVGGNGVVGFVGGATGVVGSSVRGIGVRGTSGSADGVFGRSLSANGVVGVGGTARVGGDTAAGVLGQSNAGYGVRGVSGSGQGVVGLSYGGGEGVHGLNFSAAAGAGASGTSVLGIGVEGFSFAGVGVEGRGPNGGVRGIASSTAPDVAGVIGVNPSGFAGLFIGKVRVTGFLSKGGGGFEIDHPLEPREKYLRHSFVESPEMLNVYSGNVTTDGHGEAEVALPDYFEALNEDFRYQLTVIGQFAQAIVGREITKNRFTIKTDPARVRVSWQVSGVRKDRWAAANRIVVEETKAKQETGEYLHPDVWADYHAETAPSRDSSRRAIELLPESLKERAELLLRDDMDLDELEKLAAEARAVALPSAMDPARLEEEWRQVEQLVERMRP